MTSSVVLNGVTEDDRGYEFRVLVQTSEPIDNDEENGIANAVVRAARVQMARVLAKHANPDRDMLNAAKNLAYWLCRSMEAGDAAAENEVIDSETAKAINGMKSAIANAEEYLEWANGKFDAKKEDAE